MNPDSDGIGIRTLLKKVRFGSRSGSGLTEKPGYLSRIIAPGSAELNLPVREKRGR